MTLVSSVSMFAPEECFSADVRISEVYGQWHYCPEYTPDDPETSIPPHGSLQQLAQTLILHALTTANGEVTKERKIQADGMVH